MYGATRTNKWTRFVHIYEDGFRSATLIRTWGFVGVGMRIENAEYTDLTIIKFAYLVREIIKSVY